MILTPDAKPDYADEYVYYEDDPSLGTGPSGEEYYYYDYEDDFRNPNYFPEKAGPNSVGYWPKDPFRDGTLTSKGFKQEAENFIGSVFNPPFRYAMPVDEVKDMTLSQSVTW